MRDTMGLGQAVAVESRPPPQPKTTRRKCCAPCCVRGCCRKLCPAGGEAERLPRAGALAQGSGTLDKYAGARARRLFCNAGRLRPSSWRGPPTWTLWRPGWPTCARQPQKIGGSCGRPPLCAAETAAGKTWSAGPCGAATLAWPSATWPMTMATMLLCGWQHGAAKAPLSRQVCWSSSLRVSALVVPSSAVTRWTALCGALTRPWGPGMRAHAVSWPRRGSPCGFASRTSTRDSHLAPTWRRSSTPAGLQPAVLQDRPWEPLPQTASVSCPAPKNQTQGRRRRSGCRQIHRRGINLPDNREFLIALCHEIIMKGAVYLLEACAA